MGVRAIDLTGQRFGRLVARTYLPGTTASPKGRWVCSCDCGKSAIAIAAHLRSGRTQSCGCLRKERQRAALSAMARHGMTRTPIYAVWSTMVARCHNPKAQDYPTYGARGITVCDRWRDFANFHADMGDRPNGTSLDRIDGTKGYQPGNCRWATVFEQNTNKSNSLHVVYEGEVLPLITACSRAAVVYSTARKRLHRDGHYAGMRFADLNRSAA